jgi:tRNA(fMet)-specific endonuclease VapC
MAILIDADSLPAEEFEGAAITVAELWHGVERARSAHRAKRQKFLQESLTTFDIIPYTDQTAFVHARLWAELESGGQIIGAHDLILAATALERGSAVATFNKRHFGVVQGLKVIEPV